MLNITYRGREIYIWVRKKTNVTYMLKSENGSGHGQGTSAECKITDGHCILHLETLRKENTQRKTGETVDRGT